MGISMNLDEDSLLYEDEDEDLDNYEEEDYEIYTYDDYLEDRADREYQQMKDEGEI